ncbi:MAG: hypothetical protein ACO1RX_01160 [Candidatus Sericytochromatia bacterium]
MKTFSQRYAHLIGLISFSLYLASCSPIYSSAVTPPSPQPSPDTTGLALIGYFDGDNYPVYCAKAQPHPSVAAPYDLVVTPDGQTLYWLGKDDTKHHLGQAISSRRYLYRLSLAEPRQPERVQIKGAFPLDCGMGDELEIDSQGNLYVTHPLDHEIYRLDPLLQDITSIFRETNLTSEITPLPADYINEKGERVSSNYVPPLRGPLTLLVSTRGQPSLDGVLYRMYVSNSEQRDERLRRVKSATEGEEMTEQNQLEIVLLGLRVPSTLRRPNFQVAAPHILGFHYTHAVQSPQAYVFVNDPVQHRLWKMSAPGNAPFPLDEERDVYMQATLSLFAGTGEPGLRDGSILEAQFNQPHGLAFDAAGNLYVADTGNHAIRKITPEGQVSTVYRAEPG